MIKIRLTNQVQKSSLGHGPEASIELALNPEYPFEAALADQADALLDAIINLYLRLFDGADCPRMFQMDGEDLIITFGEGP